MSTPVSLRHRLLAAGVEIDCSQLAPKGKAMLWGGRKLLGVIDLKTLNPVTMPKGTTRACLCQEDFERERQT